MSYDNPKTPEGVDDSSSNPMQSPMDSVMAMFLMSLTNFGDYYGAFEKTEHQFEAKVGNELFVDRFGTYYNFKKYSNSLKGQEKWFCSHSF